MKMKTELTKPANHGNPKPKHSGHKAPLGDDTIPNENQSHHCLSCGAPMTALHCGACGQKNDDYRRSVFSLGKDFIDGLFSFDSRVWRSWGALLFKPGKVARAFADGARTRYTPPVRSYICVSILLFLFLSIFQIDILQVRVDETPEKETESTFVVGEKSYALDIRFLERHDPDFVSRLNEQDLIEGLKRGAADKDEATFIETSSGLVRNIVNNPNHLDQTIRTWLPRLIFIMIPIAVLLGKIMIWGRKALLYDHAVHALYLHSVTFMALFLTILAGQIIPKPAAFLAFIVCVLLYVPISTKIMFERGWFRSVITAYSVMLAYLMAMLCVIIGIMSLQMG